MRQNEYKMVFAIFLTAFLAPAVRGADGHRGYIYDAINEGDNRAVVVDLITRYVGIQDKRNARINGSFSEFGGFYEDCGNDIYYCSAGPLDIVIPKSMPLRQWQYNELFCKVIKRSGDDVFRVTCSSSRLYGTGTSFTYSLSRGILSFGNSRVGGTRGGFVLRGQRGLFSSGNNP